MLHILQKLYLDPTVSLSRTTKIKPPTSIERKQKNMKWNKNFQNIYRVFMELRLRQQQTKFTRALRVHWHSDLQLFNHWAIIHSLRRAQFFKPSFFASQALCAQRIILLPLFLYPIRRFRAPSTVVVLIARYYFHPRAESRRRASQQSMCLRGSRKLFHFTISTLNRSYNAAALTCAREFVAGSVDADDDSICGTE